MTAKVYTVSVDDGPVYKKKEKEKSSAPAGDGNSSSGGSDNSSIPDEDMPF
jgi:hypothetical protein